MVQPIDYSINVPDPTQSFMRSFEVGSTISGAQAVQAEAVRKAEQQQMTAAAIARLQQPGATAADYAKLAMMLPKDQAESIRESFSLINVERQETALKQAGEVFSAFKAGQPAIAIQLMERQIEAKRNSGDEPGAKFLETFRDVAREDPKSVEDYFGFTISQIPGGDKVIDAVIKMREAPTVGQFKVLTPARIAELGLGTGSFQEDVNTGKVTAIGSGGVTINMPPAVGPIPKDFRMNYDPQNRPISMEVIPGSKTALELATAESKRGIAAGTSLTSSNIVGEEIGRLKSLVKNQTVLSPVTGVTGALVAGAGPLAAGSARRSAEAVAETIRANIGFDRLNQMRLESPTGGALGNITEQELKFLQAVLGSLNLDQKDTDLIKSLNRLEKIYDGIIKKAAAYPNAGKFGFDDAAPANPAAPAGAPTVNVGGQTFARPAGFTDEQWAGYKRAMGVTE
jgi:hypothetical protein